MSLLTTLQNDMLTARKERDNITSSLLVTLVSEASMPGFNDGKRTSTDAEVMAAIKKFLKNNAEVLAVRPQDTIAHKEREILERYLPKQLSDDELLVVLRSIVSSLGLQSVTGKDVGNVMKLLSSQYAGQYDGAKASALIKTL